MSPDSRAGAGALLLLILALLGVGVVSSTPLRHLIQALPAALALVPAIRGASWAKYAAIPIFAFWLLIMGLIWLYLLGLARIVTGRFTSAEIVLTFAIGLASLGGLAAALRASSSASVAARVAAAAAVSAALQIGAMWLSLRPIFSRS